MSGNGTVKDEALIRSVVARWARATGAKDVDAVLAHIAPAAVRFTLAPPLKAESQPRAGMNAWFATWEGPFRYEPHTLTVHIDGGVAFAHGFVHLIGTKVDGFRTDLWFRQTLGLKRIGATWLIVHLHQSVPFQMDGSFKAATDLKP